MSMSDPIADMLTRIRNAYMAGHKQVSIPFSKIKLAISNVLKEQGYIGAVVNEETDERGMIEILLKYPTTGEKAIREIKRISTPGRRVYVKSNELKKFKRGLGIYVVSTSKGVMAGHVARSQGLGGELICSVW